MELKTPEISLTLLLGYQYYDRCTPFRSYTFLIDHSCFRNTSYLSLRGIFFRNLNLSCLSNLPPPLKICHNLCCHNFETISNTCERGVFNYLVYSHDQVMHNNRGTFFLVPFQELIRVLLTVTLSKNSLEFFILLYFCKSCLQS